MARDSTTLISENSKMLKLESDDGKILYVDFDKETQETILTVKFDDRELSHSYVDDSTIQMRLSDKQKADLVSHLAWRPQPQRGSDG